MHVNEIMGQNSMIWALTIIFKTSKAKAMSPDQVFVFYP